MCPNADSKVSIRDVGQEIKISFFPGNIGSMVEVYTVVLYVNDTMMW